MSRDESHFNVLLIAKDTEVIRQCPQTTTFEEKGEPKQIRTEVALLTSLTVGPNRLHRTVTNKVSKHFALRPQRRGGLLGTGTGGGNSNSKTL